MLDALEVERFLQAVGLATIVVLSITGLLTIMTAVLKAYPLETGDKEQGGGDGE